MEIQSYKNLIVWQKAVELAGEVYKLTKDFPEDEKYGLVSQMRRAAISIPANIAEGYRRHTTASYSQFLSVAYGSGGELETQIEICKRNLGLNREKYKQAEALLGEVMKMLNVLISKLRATRYGLRTKRGFTMMELLIAMALFATVVALASGIFIRALRTQRATVALVAANSNASLAMEQMSREMRTGSEFSADVDGHGITFYSAREEGNVTYSWSSADKSIERSDPQIASQRITAENVVVENLLFRLCEECGDSYPPRVTFILQVSAPGASEQAPFISLQTTVSSRAF